MLYSVLQLIDVSIKFAAFPTKNRFMLHVKYLSDSHLEKANNCLSRCTISRKS